MKRVLDIAGVVEAIHEHKGNLAAVGRQFGVTRDAVSKYCLRHPTCGQAYHAAFETMLDEAESVLYRKALEGSTPELLFLLKTKGRSRGYVERAEVDHSGTIGMYRVDIDDDDSSAT